MTSPPIIEARLEGLRRRISRMLGLHGISWIIAVSLGIVLVSGLADWLLDLSAGVRAVLLALLVAATGWTGYRLLASPLLVRLRDVDLALRVESQFPKLNDQLASAVEFLQEPPESNRSGSPALKRAVVEQAAGRALAIDFNTALDWRASRQALACASAVVAVALTFLIARPASARIALVRLVNPFGQTSWPRETHLELLDPPLRLARGEPFRLTVAVARGDRVPPRAEVFYEFDGGDKAREPLRPHGERQFTGGLQAVMRSFDFYVRAGDGLTDLVHVDVVPPPEIKLLKLRLSYPAYTGQPPEDLPDGKGQVTAVWGTEVELVARASKPLAGAELRLEPDATVPAALDRSGTELRASFQLQKSGSYWIALRDRDGFSNREASRYELHMLGDRMPDVFIERPASDIEVSPTADVPLRVAIKDDFGIQDATLEYTTSASESKNETPLWSGSDRPRRQTVEHTWHLAELGLSPGSWVSFRVTARDTDELRGPNIGQSRQLRLHVVSPEELARRLEDRQLVIYQELERLRKLEAQARSQVADLSEQLAAGRPLDTDELSQLQSAEMLQRQINRRVTSPSEGLQTQVEQLQQDLANNRITDSAVQEQVAAVQAGLDQIAREELPPIEQNLARVRKAVEAEPDDTAPQREGLGQAQKHQDAVIASLDELLERLGKWETYRGIARDVRELLEQQEQLGQQTRETGRQTIGQKLESLPADTQAELSKLAARQGEARDQLGRLERKMEQMSGRLGESDPVAADALRDAVDSSRRAGTSEQMARASSNIRQNQVGAAQDAQNRAVEDLKQMLDTLENNLERDLAKIVQKLKEAEAKLADLRSRQSELRRRTQQAESMSDAAERRRELEKLARQQKELEQETARLAQQLRRLRAEQAGRTSSSAAERMAQAGSQMEQGEGDQAQAEEQKVLEDLEKAQREVADARREAEAQLAMEQLARIGDTLASLYERQKAVKEETVRLDQARQGQPTWTRAQLASLRTLAQSQEVVRQDTDKAREVLTAAPVFALTLARAISNMERAVERLAERQADAETQAAEQTAADRLAQLLDALKQDSGSSGEQQQQGGGGGGGGGGGAPRDGIPPIAQLKMLRSLQIEINERTRELGERAEREQKLSPAQQKELTDLGEEQGTLADLVRALTEPADEGDNP
jgi:hypothetical protein